MLEQTLVKSRMIVPSGLVMQDSYKVDWSALNALVKPDKSKAPFLLDCSATDMYSCTCAASVICIC